MLDNGKSQSIPVHRCTIILFKFIMKELKRHEDPASIPGLGYFQRFLRPGRLTMAGVLVPGSGRHSTRAQRNAFRILDQHKRLPN